MKKELDDLRKVAHKVGTVLLNCSKNGEIPLERTFTKDHCAEKVSDIFGVRFPNGKTMQLVSGRSLESAVQQGQVGVSPARRGRRSVIPEKEYNDIATLLHTCLALEQANVDIRLSRSECISLVGAVVNSKYDHDDTVFYRRITQDNARMNNVGACDQQDARRVRWLTYQAQEQHYKNWEHFVVDNGFAKWPMNDQERKAHGNVIFQDTSKILQPDEMAFTLNGEDEHAGGRPSLVYTVHSIPDAGEPVLRSSLKCTILACVTFADEAIPPLIIFPTSAKDKVKVNPAMLQGFQQICGQWGFNRTQNFVDATIAYTPKGGMTSELWAKWSLQVLVKIFPDASPANPYLVKLDSGTGRGSFGAASASFTARTRDMGFFFYPGLPNGTEIGQEMDQIFGPMKKVLYENRDLLYKERLLIEGAGKATLSLDDIGYILFGGDVPLPNGQLIHLKAAFTMGLRPENIRSAREKCGYCPATRNALKSDRLRHEIVETEGTEVESGDPYSSLISMMEQDNHHAAEALISAGYSETAVNSLRRDAPRITEAQVSGRNAVSTMQNTRERQDLLGTVKTAGQFFRYTMGGDALNCTDMLLAYARANMEEEHKSMLKRKELASKFQPIKEKFDALIASGRPIQSNPD